VERRQGRPAVVKGTEGKDGEGILRIEFRENDKLDDIDWDTFFETFDDRELAFLYQDKTSDGKESRFFKFVKRESH
jgi:glutathione synthase/RimK-type ligase-like ATP-grasp enzyme